MGDLLLLNGDVSDIYSRDKEQHQVLGHHLEASFISVTDSIHIG